MSDEYESDPNRADFHTAITNFLSIGPEVLKAVEQEVFLYYKDCEQVARISEVDFGPVVDDPADLWRHIRLGNLAIVSRRDSGDKGIYVSLDCDPEWEEEHGLEFIFKNGLVVNKIGQCDLGLTNADSYFDPALEDVIYVPMKFD